MIVDLDGALGDLSHKTRRLCGTEVSEVCGILDSFELMDPVEIFLQMEIKGLQR